MLRFNLGNTPKQRGQAFWLAISFNCQIQTPTFMFFADRYNPQALRRTTTLTQNSGFSGMIKVSKQKGIDNFG